MKIQQNLAIRLLRVLRYNKIRIERALALMPANKRPVFHTLPFLIHINHPDFPGYVDDNDAIFGINNYSLRDEVKSSLAVVFAEHKAVLEDMKSLWPKARVVESVLLMGSVGTIAQTQDSDFDYWVCLDSEHYSAKARGLLQQKLELIEQWALKEHGLEVHFFLSEIDRVRRNDFGDAEGESSGSAQPIFLKAEFYTTNIVVAGKAPFWWLMPDRCSDNQYAELIQLLTQGTSPDPSWFMDLGNLEKMEPNEIFGAAIWQISKAMDSPFKSVLKMAKLEVFLENVNQAPLCNVLKRNVHDGALAKGDLEQIDPYALMFDQLTDFYHQRKDTETINLLRLCLYLKCGTKLSHGASGKANFKDNILRSYVESWGWTSQQIAKIDTMKRWSFAELSQLSKQIHSFLIACYRRMSAKMPGGTPAVSPEDMTVLGRKIDAFYSKKDDKVEYLRSAFDDELYRTVVTIRAEVVKGGKRQWSLFEGDQINTRETGLPRSLLRTSENPIDLLIWGVSNRILDKGTAILLGYQTEPLTEDDFYYLVEKLSLYFPPRRLSEIPRKPLLVPAEVSRCAVIVNTESRRLKAEVEDVNVIYTSSWGERYHRFGADQLAGLRPLLLEQLNRPETYLIALPGSHKDRLMAHFKERTGLQFTPV